MFAMSFLTAHCGGAEDHEAPILRLDYLAPFARKNEALACFANEGQTQLHATPLGRHSACLSGSESRRLLCSNDSACRGLKD
jgi:hypothetical protein